MLNAIFHFIDSYIETSNLQKSKTKNEWRKILEEISPEDTTDICKFASSFLLRVIYTISAIKKDENIIYLRYYEALTLFNRIRNKQIYSNFYIFEFKGSWRKRSIYQNIKGWLCASLEKKFYNAVEYIFLILMKTNELFFSVDEITKAIIEAEIEIIASNILG